MYQVRELQDAFNAIEDMFDRMKSDQDERDEQLTKAVGALDDIASGCDAPATVAAAMVKELV